VQEYRHGRIFLAGDSAHIHSPVGGQGMNTGVHDAFNLSWKLALVEKGAAPESLLDSYQKERHPIGQALLKATDAAMKVIAVRQPLAQKLRNELMHILSQQECIQHRMVRIGAMVAVNYRRSPIVGEFRSRPQHALVNPRSIGEKVKDWLDFAHGPAPGDRAPDADLKGADGKDTRLFEVMRGTKHNLLLFAAANGTTDDIKDLEAICKRVLSRFQDYINVSFILPSNSKPGTSAQGGKAYTDADDTTHHKYGADRQCLYLIRPDGYVGFRSQPADVESLMEHLKLIFI
jgi:hypothetical protein